MVFVDTMILFRCNVSPQIGFGHLTRCRALAYALREQGQHCVMAGPDKAYTNAEDVKLFTAWESVKWEGAETDASCIAALASHYGSTSLVLDDYRVDEDYQLVLRRCGLNWLQFETRTDRPIWADLVLNANPAAKAEDYAHVLRNPATKLLLGPHYAVLRPEFALVKPKDPNRPVRKVLVTFGGGDDRGAILFALTTLLPATPKQVTFVVVSGDHNPRNAEIADWIGEQGQGRVILKINPQPIAPLFADCDFAIIGGGTTTYEVACCGLPMLLITIANNQIAQSCAWSKLGAARWMGNLKDMNSTNLLNVFHSLMRDPQARVAMSHKGSYSIDGKGAEHCAKCILTITNDHLTEF